jgi:nitroimidazol reductase NimA-like FMN-containing flavoprotein (pyridoxamine 5'-phosphate oxidase superfamily)
VTQRVIETLSEAQCFELVRQEIVGRFVFQDADGVGAVPVNYGVAGTQIVFRTEQASHLRDVLKGPVAFEVDHPEPESGAGWSVLIRGTGREVAMEHVPELLHLTGTAFPHPWGEGVHNIWVALTATKVTGRRLAAAHLPAYFF